MSAELVRIKPEVENSIRPKPTRSEVVDALVRLQIENSEAENAKMDADRKAAYQEVCGAAVALAASIPNEEWDVTVPSYHYDRKFSVSVQRSIPSSKLPRAIRDKWLKVCDSRALLTDPKKIRASIQAKLNGMQSQVERVDSMLADDATRDALQSMLKALTKEAK